MFIAVGDMERELIVRACACGAISSAISDVIRSIFFICLL